MLFASVASAQVAPSVQNLAQAKKAAVENTIRDKKQVASEKLEKSEKSVHEKIRLIDEQIEKAQAAGRSVKQLEEQRRVLLESMGAN